MGCGTMLRGGDYSGNAIEMMINEGGSVYTITSQIKGSGKEDFEVSFFSR